MRADRYSRARAAVSRAAERDLGAHPACHLVQAGPEPVAADLVAQDERLGHQVEGRVGQPPPQPLHRLGERHARPQFGHQLLQVRAEDLRPVLGQVDQGGAHVQAAGDGVANALDHLHQRLSDAIALAGVAAAQPHRYASPPATLPTRSATGEPSSMWARSPPGSAPARVVPTSIGGVTPSRPAWSSQSPTRSRRRARPTRAGRTGRTSPSWASHSPSANQPERQPEVPGCSQSVHPTTGSQV